MALSETVVAGKVNPIVPPRAPASVRRFELPDIARHNGWLYKRVGAAYPLLDAKRGGVDAFLRGIIYSNEFLFLCQEHSAALAQLCRPYGLEPRKIVKEQFVFAEAEIFRNEASDFYLEFLRWAKANEADAIVLSDMSDVPEEKIREKLGGRLSERKELFARL